MPDWILSATLMLLGFAGLIAGSGLVVRSMSAFAASLGMGRLPVGLLVGVLAAVMPDLAMTLQAVRSGAADLALGGVMGAVMVTLLLGLGAAAIVAPLVVSRRVLRREFIFVIMAALAIWALAANGRFGYLDGTALLTLLFVQLAWQAMSDGLPRPEHAGLRLSVPATLGAFAFMAVGVLILALGARLTLMGAVDLGLVLGIGNLGMGMTFVSIGLTLPEIAIVVMAGLRGRGEMALGVVIWSCLFNLLGVAGLGAVAAPNGIRVAQEVVVHHLPVLSATLLLGFLLALAGRRIARIDGAVLCFVFAAFVADVLMRSSDAAWTRVLDIVMLGVIIPATLFLGVTRLLWDLMLPKAVGGSCPRDGIGSRVLEQ